MKILKASSASNQILRPCANSYKPYSHLFVHCVSNDVFSKKNRYNSKSDEFELRITSYKDESTNSGWTRVEIQNSETIFWFCPYKCQINLKFFCKFFGGSWQCKLVSDTIWFRHLPPILKSAFWNSRKRSDHSLCEFCCT